MAGLEIPGFIVGLSGCIVVAEKGFTIWQSIGEANVFGSNVVEDVAKLSMEYYRFEAWTNAVSFLVASQQPSKLKAPDLGALSPPFESAAPTKNVHDALLKDAAKPFETAVGQIVKVMEEVAPILKRYQTKDGNFPAEQKFRKRDKSVSGGLASIMSMVSIDQSHSFHSFASPRKMQEQKFQHGVSFRKRFTYSTSPWKETDRQALQKSAKRLEGLFPAQLQRSLFAQAVPAKMLGGTTWERRALQAFAGGSSLYGTEILKSASLWHSRLELEKCGSFDWKDKSQSHDDLEKSPEQHQQASYQQSPYQPETGVLILGQSQSKSPMSALKILERAWQADTTCTRPHKSSHQWHEFGTGWDAYRKRVARERLVRLAVMCQRPKNPEGLRILTCCGFTEDKDRNAFGMFFALPIDVHLTKPLASLEELFPTKERPSLMPLPTIADRLRLARQLASSLYSFHLVGWFHKSYSSKNVAFFYDNIGTLALGRPITLGFKLSRPEDAPNLSYEVAPRTDELFLHPAVRDESTKTGPSYERRYDIYSLGLLLYEIGTWSSVVHRYGDVADLTAEEFKAKMVDRATSDLPFHVGTRYRDIVVRCLLGEDSGDTALTVSLETFYLSSWSS